MATHSNRQQQRDELAFPVRVKIAIPPHGLGRASNEMHDLLSERLGAGNYASHSTPGFACSTAAFYFRDVDSARNFVLAFPTAQLQMARIRQPTAQRQEHGDGAMAWE